MAIILVYDERQYLTWQILTLLELQRGKLTIPALATAGILGRATSGARTTIYSLHFERLTPRRSTPLRQVAGSPHTRPPLDHVAFLSQVPITKQEVEVADKSGEPYPYLLPGT